MISPRICALLTTMLFTVCVSLADAAPITFFFAGEFSSDTSTTPFIPLGTPFSGRITYETSTPPPNTGMITIGYPDAITSFEFSFLGLEYKGSGGILRVSNNFARLPAGVALDEFQAFPSISVSPLFDGFERTQTLLLFEDTDASAFSSVALPNDVILDDFEDREFRTGWKRGDEFRLVSGQVQTWTQVPTPSSFVGLLSLGGLAVFCMRRRGISDDRRVRCR